MEAAPIAKGGMRPRLRAATLVSSRRALRGLLGDWGSIFRAARSGTRGRTGRAFVCQAAGRWGNGSSPLAGTGTRRKSGAPRHRDHRKGRCSLCRPQRRWVSWVVVWG